MKAVKKAKAAAPRKAAKAPAKKAGKARGSLRRTPVKAQASRLGFFVAQKPPFLHQLYRGTG